MHEEEGRRGAHRFRWQHQIFIRESHLLNELEEHAPAQETVAILVQLQPMANEDETGSYEHERGKVVRQEWSTKRRKHVLKFFCHTKASIYLSAGKVGMEVT